MNGEEQATAEQYRPRHASSLLGVAMKIREHGVAAGVPPAAIRPRFEEAWAIDSEGALWKRSQLDGCRVAAAPELKRVVVAIDPSGGTTKRSDECGVVVCGLGFDGRGYVLHDGSGKMEPVDWGKRAIALYERFQADRIIAERNFGGDMVKATIRAINERVPYADVSASRGKAQRAEPVAALYAEGRVSHVGMFAALEDELATWIPGSTRSPNRLDALVWCITELMLQEKTQYDESLSWVSAASESTVIRHSDFFGLY
jgi:phage terminase large subunit-like protein